MIPELLLGLVGFTGGVVVEKGDTFTVNMDFDMITEAERVANVLMCHLRLQVYKIILHGYTTGANKQNCPLRLVLQRAE